MKEKIPNDDFINNVKNNLLNEEFLENVFNKFTDMANKDNSKKINRIKSYSNFIKLADLNQKEKEYAEKLSKKIIENLNNINIKMSKINELQNELITLDTENDKLEEELNKILFK